MLRAVFLTACLAASPAAALPPECKGGLQAIDNALNAWTALSKVRASCLGQYSEPCRIAVEAWERIEAHGGFDGTLTLTDLLLEHACS